VFNHYPDQKMSCAKCLVCYNLQSTPKPLKVGENIVRVSNSLGPSETPSISASHPDPSCFPMTHRSRLVG